MAESERVDRPRDQPTAESMKTFHLGDAESGDVMAESEHELCDCGEEHRSGDLPPLVEGHGPVPRLRSRRPRVWQKGDRPPGANVKVIASDGTVLVCLEGQEDGDTPLNGWIWHREDEEHTYAPWWGWINTYGSLTEVLEGRRGRHG